MLALYSSYKASKFIQSSKFDFQASEYIYFKVLEEG